MKRFVVMFALALVSATGISNAHSQTPAKVPALMELDDYAHRLLQRYGIAGMGIVAVREGRVVYQQGFGTANGSHAFDPRTRFYIASNTKAFTGLAMARLVASHKVRLGDPVTRFIPRKFFSPAVDVDSIRVRDLLTHTTGLADDALVFRSAYSGQLPADERSLLRYCEYRLDDHGKQFHYSNLGYLMAGMIIRRVTGMTWQSYLEQEILKPAGMKHTGPHVPPSAGNTALPFELGSDTPLAFRKRDATLHAAGGLYSTLEDMGRWLTLFTDSGQTRLPQRDLREASRELLAGLDEGMGPFRMQGYGYGWIHGTVLGSPLQFHFGRFPGYDSMMSYAPQDKLGIFVYVSERRGGLRVAGALSALYYTLMRQPAEAAHMRKSLDSMIAQQYASAPEARPVALKRSLIPGLSGRYRSPKYGVLEVHEAGEGYRITLGDLSSLAFRGDESGRIRLDWIPGKAEYLQVRKSDHRVLLQYGDYGTFVRLDDRLPPIHAESPSKGNTDSD